MITYEQLWSADPSAWRDSAVGWRGATGWLTDRSGEFSGTADRLSGAWSGAAARAALGRIAELRATVSDGRPAMLEVDQLLSEFADRLDRARALLSGAVAAAEEARLAVDRSGAVSFGWSPSPSAPGIGARAAAETSRARVASDIRAALALAGSADAETARRLVELARATGSGPLAEAPADLPAPDSSPAQVRRWWDGLAAEQRRWLLARCPELVGRLDGLPAAVRDQANRLLLTGQRAELTRRRAVLLAGPRPSWVLAEVSRLSRTIAGLDALAARLATGSGRRAYLLALGTEGDGRAVVAVGDPDHADNVLTYVPGMTTDLANAAGELDRVDRVVTRCGDLGPAAGTAGVLWLDYDAPDFVDQAAQRKAATAAGPGLHRFLDGLRSGHEGPPARHTVLGHSYGSLVVGSTAHASGLAADALVFVGSPGVGVEHAAQLGLPTNRIWATTAGNDVIQYAARSPAGLVADALGQPGPPGPHLPLALAQPGRELWFGRNPVDPGFGAGTFAGAPHGHSGYWDPGNPALDGMARIVLSGHP